MNRLVPALSVLVVLFAAAFLAVRIMKVESFYREVAARAVAHLEAGEIDRCEALADYLAAAGRKHEEAEVRKRLDEVKKKLARVEEDFIPLMDDGNFEAALAKADESDLSRPLKEYLRAKVYDRWGWIVVSANLSGSYELYALRPDGSQCWRLTFNSCEEMNPDVSPDGNVIAYTRLKEDIDRTVALFDLSTGREKWLPVTGKTNLDPAFSPDGTKIAYAALFASYAYLYTYDFGSGEVLRLTRGVVVNQPAWSPDGKHIIFEGVPKGVERTPIQIMMVSSDGSGEHPITAYRTGHSRDPAFAPDGEHFAFRRDDDIYIGVIGEGEPQPVSDPELTERQPSFSPDGRYLVYVAVVNGTDRLVRHDLRTGERFFLPPIGTGCQFPVWTRRLTLPPGAKKVPLPRPEE